MEVRLIDGEMLKNAIQYWIDTQSEFVDVDTCRTVLSAIDILPTLTPPNEELTYNGCIHEYDEHENCNYCRRAPFLSDYYHHYSLKE